MWKFLKDFKLEVCSVLGIIFFSLQNETGFEIQLFRLDYSAWYAIHRVLYIEFITVHCTKLGSLSYKN